LGVLCLCELASFKKEKKTNYQLKKKRNYLLTILLWPPANSTHANRKLTCLEDLEECIEIKVIGIALVYNGV